MPGERTAAKRLPVAAGHGGSSSRTRELPSARAAMITGSVAEGISDHFSDLDMTVYYEGELPSEEVAGADPGRPRRAGARLVHGRARRGQHRRGVRAPRRAGADRARDDRRVGKRHRGGAGAVERRHAAAQGDVGNARSRRRPRRGVHRALEGEDPRLSRRARARDGGARGSSSFPCGTCRTRSTRATRRCGISRSAPRPPTTLLGILAGLEPALLHDLPVQEDAPASSTRCRSSRSGWRTALEELFRQTPAAAAASLEALVREVLALVERDMPDVDISALQRRVGGRRPRVGVRRRAGLERAGSARHAGASLTVIARSWCTRNSAAPVQAHQFPLLSDPFRVEWRSGKPTRRQSTGSGWIRFHWQRSSRNVQIDIPQPDHVCRGDRRVRFDRRSCACAKDQDHGVHRTGERPARSVQGSVRDSESRSRDRLGPRLDRRDDRARSSRKRTTRAPTSSGASAPPASRCSTRWACSKATRRKAPTRSSRRSAAARAR